MTFKNQVLSAEDPKNIKIGYLIRRARIDDGVSQSYVARVLGIDPSRMAKIERMRSVITREEKRKLLEEFDEIDDSEETEQEVKGLFRQMLSAWCRVQYSEMDRIYKVLKERTGYRYCTAFEYYDIALLQYAVLFQNISPAEQKKLAASIEEYAVLMKNDLYNYFLVLKGRCLQNAGGTKEAVEYYRAASGQTFDNEEELMNIQLEYIAANGMIVAKHYYAAARLFDRCRQRLADRYFFDRLIELDFQRANGMILYGSYMAARNILSKLREYCSVSGMQEYVRILVSDEILALLFAGKYSDALSLIRSEGARFRHTRTIRIEEVMVYYTLDMKEACLEKTAGRVHDHADEKGMNRFLEMIELAVGGAHQRAIEICDELIRETRPGSLRQIFYVKVGEIIAAKNNLYELEVKYLRMRESINAEYRDMNPQSDTEVRL